MKYQEERKASLPFREDYHHGIKAAIRARRDEVDVIRRAYITPEKVAADREAYRRDLVSFFGWPLTEFDSLDKAPMAVRKSLRCSEDFADVYSMQFEVLPNLWFYGLYYEAKNAKEKLPFVFVQHGGAGTPETIGEMWGSSNYNGIVERVMAKGANVFTPGLILWERRDEPFDPDRLSIQEEDERNYADAQLRQLGSSITAVEIFAIRRVLSYFIKEGLALPGHIGMTGMSYGGFYTLMTSASEPRIDAAFSSCQFNNRYKYDQWPDWMFFGMAEKFLDAEVASLVAPRPLFLEEAEGDEFFDYQSFLAECERTVPFYEAAGAKDKLRFRSFKGGHEYAKDDEGVSFLMDAIKF